MTGVVLAGGRGSRMRGPSKPGVLLAGRPLASYPLAALGEVCPRVAVVAKAGTAHFALPAGVERWDEPDGRHHPAVGLAHALERAATPVLVCAADMPRVDVGPLEALLAAADGDPDAAVVARAAGRLQPLLALYPPRAVASLRARTPDGPLTALVRSLDPIVVDVSERHVLSVDTPEALAEAERQARRAT